VAGRRGGERRRRRGAATGVTRAGTSPRRARQTVQTQRPQTAVASVTCQRYWYSDEPSSRTSSTKYKSPESRYVQPSEWRVYPSIIYTIYKTSCDVLILFARNWCFRSISMLCFAWLFCLIPDYFRCLFWCLFFFFFLMLSMLLLFRWYSCLFADYAAMRLFRLRKMFDADAFIIFFFFFHLLIRCVYY